jgi:hypothetical protein
MRLRAKDERRGWVLDVSRETIDACAKSLSECRLLADYSGSHKYVPFTGSLSKLSGGSSLITCLPYCLSNVSPLIIKFVFCLAENKSEYRMFKCSKQCDRSFVLVI